VFKKATPAAGHAVGGGEAIAERRCSPNSTSPRAAPVGSVADALAAERSRNAALPPLEQIKRARELLEAAGLGHLRPDKAWRPRSWQDRLAAIPHPEGQLIESVAEAIYATHLRPSSPEWKRATEHHKEWSRAQALSALACLRRAVGEK
jgi:hypothetical protein